MESSIISYHNSGIGWTNDWYDKIKADKPRIYHKYMNAEFIRRFYGENNETIGDDPIDDSI